MSSTENVRRSSRIKALAKDKGSINYALVQNGEEPYECSTTVQPGTIEKELEDVEEIVQRPVELFSNDDVNGQVLYKFQTPKKNTMTQKANLCRTPLTTKLEKLSLMPKVILVKVEGNTEELKTNVRNSNEKAVAQRRRASQINLSDSESVSESSEYVPTDEQSESESSQSSNTDSSDDEENQFETKVSKQKLKLQSNLLDTPKRMKTRNTPIIIHKDYHMKTDEYFETQTEKVITSDRTLEHLRNSRLTKEKLEQLLSNQSSVSTRHKEHIYSLTKSYTELFPAWHFIMEQGYTVLLYGVGSKRCLINDFHKNVSYHPSLVVNGFFPSLTIKDIVDGIIVDLLNLKPTSNIGECVDTIEKCLKKNPNDRLYLLIHNIDGVMLRSDKAQDLLSCLAGIPNLYVLASVDHINAPLLWDHIKRSKFNFFWWDTTTFLSYQQETSYEGSLLVQQSGALALSSLHNVFLSLTSNAKAIYLILAKNQLRNSNDVNFIGMPFRDLYRAAREGFLVSSDLALRAQLTEFIDHKLVKTKRSIDSVEHLIIPMNNTLLKQFLEEHES